MATPALKPATKATKLHSVEDELKARDADTRNIAQRIAAVMGEVDYVQKEKKQGMNYSIVSHDAVTAKVRPLLHKHGVIYYPRGLQVQQNGNRTEAVFTVRFENIDDRTDYIDVETFGYGVDPQDKGPGKAMSYGVKYALLKVLGLETGDDPDTVQDNSADHRTEPRGVDPKLLYEIKDLCPKAGKTVGDICAAYSVEDLADLNTKQATAAITRLKSLVKEPANA